MRASRFGSNRHPKGIKRLLKGIRKTYWKGEKKISSQSATMKILVHVCAYFARFWPQIITFFFPPSDRSVELAIAVLTSTLTPPRYVWRLARMYFFFEWLFFKCDQTLICKCIYLLIFNIYMIENCFAHCILWTHMLVCPLQSFGAIIFAILCVLWFAPPRMYA